MVMDRKKMHVKLPQVMNKLQRTLKLSL